MFFILSKTISQLFMPLTTITLCFLFSFWIKNKVWTRRLRVLGLALLLICSNSFLVGQVMKWWEIEAVPFENLERRTAVAIVLTGVVNTSKKPQDRIYFHAGADRITHALRLYQEGYVQKIVVSGGTGNIWDQSLKEAPLLAKFLQRAGVPAEDIIVESNSRNTYESAQAVKEILQANFSNHQYILITSAFHMRRAKAVFDHQQVNTTCFSADFRTGDLPPNIFTFLVPSTGALHNSTILVKEWMGFLAYKFAGYA
jgi:uncharacterized SAM-binding protein YcdF (DUF218 family)